MSYDKCSKNDGTEKGCSTETHLGNDELLADRPVTTRHTETAGCKINRSNKPNNESPFTYAKHVARIRRDRCVACHREGEIAPFALASYNEAAGWAEMIDEVVRGGRMPPWHASLEFGRFSNDCRRIQRLEADRTSDGRARPVREF
jgi:hypothetical protein